MEFQILHKVHNFGIYRKGGKRCILQLDFPGRLLLVIHKGHIKKTHSLDLLQHFDSEDGLHVSLKSKDGELEFEADNTEEKYSICRLLGLAMQSSLEEDEDSIDSGQGHQTINDSLPEHNEVIKDGILDKKGNTTITTWNKRRVRLSPGELSYYKPGEELALNIIQLWHDHCVLKRHSYNGLTLTVRERVYSFRIANEYKATHMTEIARDDWFEAFEKALNHAPPTAKLLDMSLGGHNSASSSTIATMVSQDSGGPQSSNDTAANSTTESDHIYDVTPDELAQAMNSINEKSIPPASPDQVQFNHRDMQSPIIYIDTPPPLPKFKSLSRRHSSDNLLSTQKTKTLPDRHLPTSAKESLWASSKLSMSHCDLSQSVTRVSSGLPESQSLDVVDDDDDGDDNDDPLKEIFSGTAAAFREKLAQRGGKSSSLKTYRANKAAKKEVATIKKNSGRRKGWIQQSHNMLVQSSDRTLQIRPPGKAHKKTRHPGWDFLFSDRDSKATTPRPSSLENDENLQSASSATSTTSFQTFLGEATPICQSETVRKLSQHVTPPTPPSVPVHLSRPTAVPPPPPPPMPMPKDVNFARRRSSSEHKLKQVHWVKVSTTQIPWSVWKNARDRTNELDLQELEQQFALSETKQSASKLKTDEDKKMLVDPKRAQNLGILFSGLKLDSLTKLTEALSSITEVDSFPVDKMATLKRYQPTSEEMDLYRLHGNRRDALHEVDRFMLELCEIPRLGTRVELILTLWEYPGQLAALEEEIGDLLTACDQLMSSACLLTVLEYLLAIGNHMNSAWTNRQDSPGFQLSSIDKILNVKSKDSKTTICSYLVKLLKGHNPGLLNWTSTVDHVSKCSGYSVKAVGAEIDVLKNDLQKIKRTLKVLRTQVTTEKKFYMDVQNFIVEYDLKLDQLDIKYAKVNNKCKELMTMYGEPSSRGFDAMLTGICLLINAFNLARNND